MIFIQFVDVRHLVAGNEFHQFVVHFRALRGMLFSWSINFFSSRQSLGMCRDRQLI